MASQEESFQLHFDTSDDESQSTPQYRTSVLPKLIIASPFHSEESSLDLESGSGSETPLTPATPSTPLSPLGSEFNFLAVSSQTSEPAEFATPRTRKKRLTKRRALNFKRGALFGITRDTSPSKSAKRTKLTRPQSELFSSIHFPPGDESFSVKVSYGD